MIDSRISNLSHLIWFGTSKYPPWSLLGPCINDLLDNNTNIGALDHLKGCERKYEHLEYVTFELGEKFEDAYNVFLILDDRRKGFTDSVRVWRFNTPLGLWVQGGIRNTKIGALILEIPRSMLWYHVKNEIENRIGKLCIIIDMLSFK